MKKRITLTIDEEVYEKLQDMPKRVSISEVVNYLIDAFIEEVKRGHSMNQQELKEWIEGTEDGRDFKIRFIEQYSPVLQRVTEKIEDIKEILGMKPKHSEKR
jgi:predicted CopG family antitoxin